jgi:hypothetical protein
LANDFTNDSNCVALWRFESGTLTTDSIGGNTLTNVNAVSNNTSSYKEGSACAEFAGGATQQHLKILDADLDSGFPLKSGDTTKKISVCAWFKSDTSTFETVFSSRDYDNLNSFSFTFHGTHNLAIGYNNGADSEVLSSGTTINTGTWYHVGFTFDNADKSWKLIVWNDSTGSKVIDASGTATNNISATTAPFAIGCLFNSGALSQGFDGLIDEVVVFKDILTESEIDAIRGGTYSVAAGSHDVSAEPLIGTFTLFGWNASLSFNINECSRLPLTVDHTKIDSDETNFPLTLFLSSSCGATNVDASEVFDTLSSDANRKKIAITTADQVTQCYVEIESWNTASKTAVLHVKVPSISSSQDTTLYFFYSATEPDNTDYVGDTGDAAAQNVWDNNFKTTWHMAQDPNGDGADAIKDSTSNAIDLTPNGSMTTADLVAGKVGNAIDLDGTDDDLETNGNQPSLNIGSDDFEFSFWINFNNLPTNGGEADHIFSFGNPTNDRRSYFLDLVQVGGVFYLRFQMFNGTVTPTGFAQRTPTLSTSTWYHFVIRRSGSNIYFYQDGSELGTATDIGSPTCYNNTTDSFFIGSFDGTWSIGDFIIDEFRMTIGDDRSESWAKATYYACCDNLVTFGTDIVITAPAFLGSFTLSGTVVTDMSYTVDGFSFIGDFTLSGVPHYISELNAFNGTLSLRNAVLVGSTLEIVHSLNVQFESSVELKNNVLNRLEGSLSLLNNINLLSQVSGTIDFLNRILDENQGISVSANVFSKSHGL